MGLGFKDFTAGDVLTAAQVDGYLMRQSNMVFASTAARDTALSGNLEQGMIAITTDTESVWYYDGSAWRTVGTLDTGWTSTTGAVLFNASGTNVSSNMRYRRIFGTTIEWECDWELTGSPAAGNMTITLPVAVTNVGSNAGQVVGRGVLLDSGTARYTFTVMSDASSTTVMFCNRSADGAATNSVNDTSPFTWVSGDTGLASGRYRCAVG